MESRSSQTAHWTEDSREPSDSSLSPRLPGGNQNGAAALSRASADSTSATAPGDASQPGLEKDAVSQLLAVHDELDHILQQVDEISRSLQCDFPERQKLSKALQLTVSCAVRQTLRERELRALAVRDDLTGLFNRRGFWASASQQLKLSRRNAQESLLFFCDVDDLKKINDTYGHGEGDLALMRVADVLKQTFRDSDILARLAGDEFAALANAGSSQFQETVLCRLHSNLEKSQSVEPRYRLTMSVGIALFDPAEPVHLSDLMKQADEAMYQQKRLRHK